MDSQSAGTTQLPELLEEVIRSLRHLDTSEQEDLTTASQPVELAGLLPAFEEAPHSSTQPCAYSVNEARPWSDDVFASEGELQRVAMAVYRTFYIALADGDGEKEHIKVTKKYWSLLLAVIAGITRHCEEHELSDGEAGLVEYLQNYIIAKHDGTLKTSFVQNQLNTLDDPGEGETVEEWMQRMTMVESKYKSL